MCFWGVGLKKLSFWWNFPPSPVNDNLATVSIEGQKGNTPIFQWKIHHFPPFVKTSTKMIKFCKPSLTSWFNIKDHRSHILFILSFLLCNSRACNWFTIYGSLQMALLSLALREKSSTFWLADRKSPYFLLARRYYKFADIKEIFQSYKNIHLENLQE